MPEKRHFPGDDPICTRTRVAVWVRAVARSVDDPGRECGFPTMTRMRPQRGVGSRHRSPRLWAIDAARKCACVRLACRARGRYDR